MVADSSTRERRRHVRLRPVAELPAVAWFESADGRVDLTIVDISLSGVAFARDGSIARAAVGTDLRVTLELSGAGTVEATLCVRHVGRDAPDLVGTEIVEIEPEARTLVGRYVAELLERGALS